MKEIKPFGAYPEQLQRNLKQALVASRTYIQGIAVGRNVVIAAQKVSKYEWLVRAIRLLDASNEQTECVLWICYFHYNYKV